MQKKKIKYSILSLVCAFFIFTSLTSNFEEIKKFCSKNYGTEKLNDIIYVSVSEQKLYYYKDGSLVKTYPISTSKYGIGSKANSLQTPLGLHYIREKSGSGTPLGGILINGKYNGSIAAIEKDAKSIGSDDVTTRVLWLMGCEHGNNRGKGKDSYDRKIYIHGTPEEGLIGKPASHGCIRMKNSDVIELYNKVNLGLYVLIQ